MKREIKFGAWIPRLEMMLYGITLYADGMIGIEADKFQEALTAKNPNWKLIDDEIYFSDEDHFDLIMSILPGDEWVWIEAEQCEPVEFTGLKDKNGKEIWEGDIYRTNEGVISPVEWITDEACWNISKSYIEYRGIEVIGNRFENPDLLNQ